MTASARIIIYLTPSEKKQVYAAAKKAKDTASNFGRQAVLAALAPKPKMPMPSDN